MVNFYQQHPFLVYIQLQIIDIPIHNKIEVTYDSLRLIFVNLYRRVYLTSAIAGSNTYTSPNAVVVQMEFGPGLPFTLFIWQDTKRKKNNLGYL